MNGPNDALEASRDAIIAAAKVHGHLERASMITEDHHYGILLSDERSEAICSEPMLRSDSDSIKRCIAVS